MPVTYIPIATQTLGSAAASVTFSSISAAYTDLVLVMNPSMSASTNQPVITLNSDTGTNYSTTSLRGDGSSATSSRHTNIAGWYPVPGPGVGTNGNPEPWIVNIMNYSNTTTNKTALSRFNNAISVVTANVHLWRNTSAVSTVTITMEAGTFNTGSTFSLYGVASTAVGAKATGGTIFNDGTYYYHAFTASGTFTPTSTLSCDVLVVAGGGAGGGSQGGGGGAGGLLGFTSQSVTATSYTITVGAGGSGVSASYNGAPGSNGTNSTFQGLTAAVGGGGGGTAGNTTNGVGSGGSGGGRGNSSGAGTGTTNQGYAGGNTGIAGGGGAGSVGATGTDAAGGIGATATTLVGGTAGPYSFINAMGAATGTGQLSGGNYYYAGGGGSGCAGVANGGLGGGGTGTVPAAAGASNTGGGGGGACGNPAAGGNGGSGLVIVRYPV